MLLETIEFSAVVASAIFGVLLARKKELDVVGAIFVAFVVAFGGGTLRDLCLDRHPLFWIARPHYAIIVFGLALASWPFGRFLPVKIEKYLFLPDALGLGLFTILGASFALEAGVPIFVASLLGVITGTFGGVIGDVLCNEIPRLFRTAPLYAVCSFTGCWVYLGLDACCVDRDIAVWVGVATVLVSRLAAVRWNIHLPTLKGEAGA
ncbi:MAG: trimeric intracellular cation channel family protein [Planctomycetota bacterium]